MPPRPMAVTKANITTTLRRAGYPKWSYKGMDLTPGPSVEEGIDLTTLQPVLLIIHRTSFGIVHQSTARWLSDKGPGFYRAAYVRALRERFTIKLRTVTRPGYSASTVFRVWAVFPLEDS